MNHQMHLHKDVLGRLLTILKQDDYYRTLEDLPVIKSIQAYDKVQLFPELYDTMTIIERVTSEVDLIERKLRRPGMYPLPQTPIASTSGFVPRPSSRFQPITPAAPSPVQKTDAVSQQIEPQSNGSSPGSSLPCGQDTPTAPVSSTSIPSQHKETYMPPQLVIPPQPSNLSFLVQITHITNNNTDKPVAHHIFLLLGNIDNSCLLVHKLTHLPSISFQLQQHTRTGEFQIC